MTSARTFLLALALVAVSPTAFARETTCARTISIVDRACGLPYDITSLLSRRSDICVYAQSKSGATTVQVLLNQGTGKALVINTEGQDKCVPKLVNFPGGNRVAYVSSVDGVDRSDKVFLRMQTGQLFFMEMDHDIFELKNASSRSYNVVRLDATSRPEEVQLKHAAGNVSTLTFEQIDARKAHGQVREVAATAYGSWLATVLLF